MELTSNEFLFGTWTNEFPPIEGFYCFDPNRDDGADYTLETFEQMLSSTICLTTKRLRFGTSSGSRRKNARFKKILKRANAWTKFYYKTEWAFSRIRVALPPNRQLHRLCAEALS